MGRLVKASNATAAASSAVRVAPFCWSMPMWLGKEVASLPPPPRRTGRATRAAPSSSSQSIIPGRGLHTMKLVFQSYVYPIGYLTFPLDKRSSPRLSDEPPGHVSPLSGWVLPYPAGYAFPLPFGCRRSLLGHPVPAVGLARSCCALSARF